MIHPGDALAVLRTLARQRLAVAQPALIAKGLE